MYSVILMAAMTAGGQTPDFHGNSSCRYGTCYGACYGNYGIEYNCYGTGYGTTWGSYTCSGAYASCWGSYSCCGSYPWDWSTYGCNGCWSTYGAMSPYFATPPLVAPPATTEPVPLPKPADNPPKPEASLAPTKARLIVEVPADAKLYIDDHAMQTPSEHRVYQTPELEPGQTYYYEVRVDVERDGKTLTETKRVLLHAGQEIHADFNNMTATATAKAK